MTTTRAVEQYLHLRAHEAPATASAPAAAMSLRISTRSLRRRLGVEGTNWRALYAAEMTRRMSGVLHLPAHAAAEELGYAFSTSYTRALWRLHGYTLTDARKDARKAA